MAILRLLTCMAVYVLGLAYSHLNDYFPSNNGVAHNHCFYQQSSGSDIYHLFIYEGEYQGSSIKVDIDAYPIEDKPFLYVGGIDFFNPRHNYTFRCFRTNSPTKFEIRIMRMNNTSIMGEYLSWKAYIEPLGSPSLKLTVSEGLSAIEKVKYSLPDKGAVITLSLVEKIDYRMDGNTMIRL